MVGLAWFQWFGEGVAVLVGVRVDCVNRRLGVAVSWSVVSRL